jgi:hypothetical protein
MHIIEDNEQDIPSLRKANAQLFNTALRWHKSYRDCLCLVEHHETENNNLKIKIEELEAKVVKLEANQLYQTLCMQGNHSAAKVVWEMLKSLGETNAN